MKIFNNNKPVEIIENKPVEIIENKNVEIIENKNVEIIENKPVEIIENKNVEIIENKNVEIIENKPVEIIENKDILLWEKICMPLTQNTAKKLLTKQKELEKIKWTDSEANIDSEFSKLACECCSEAYVEIKKKYIEFTDINIQVKIPDINIIFLKDENIITKGKIELKSGKGKGIIPGSTIGTLDINEPVIFCLRNEKKKTFDIRYDQYHNCIGESKIDMFQDRTPRPKVNFQKMKKIDEDCNYIQKKKNDWINHYAECAIHRINNNLEKSNNNNNLEKSNKSWQDDLVEEIKIMCIKKFIKETSVEEFIKLKNLQNPK